jgi:hypothetical protein
MSAFRSIPGDLFGEMHGHSLVLLLMNDLFMIYCHPLCIGDEVVLLLYYFCFYLLLAGAQ